MRKSKFTESQIVAILKEGEAGMPVAEVCRKHAISAPTYYAWKSKYAGATVSDLTRMRELEAENARLKRMYADLALENAAIQDVLSKKMYGPPRVCKAQASGGISSHKCIRPLASRLLLQPGRDEIRTRRSQ